MLLDSTADIISDIIVAYPKATLVRAKGKWYVQVTIPAELRPAFNGRKQERRSTRTSDKREAERRQHDIAAGIYADFDGKAKVFTPLALAAGELQAELEGGQMRAPEQWRDEDIPRGHG